MGAPWWIVIPLLLLAAVAQTSLLPAMGFVAVRPDLVLQVVVVWAVMRGVREALPWAFAGGVLLDIMSGAPFGTSALALVLVAFCASVGQMSVFRSHLLLPLLAVFWSSVLYGIIFLFLLRTHQYPVPWLATLGEIVIPNAVLNTVCTPLTYALLHQLERRTRRTVTVEW
jgi:rod shape-determining protein MreD